MLTERRPRWLRPLALDVAWVLFSIANVIAMALVPHWETVPFHFIWVSLTLLYGYRVWGLRTTAIVLTAVALTTGLLLVDLVRLGIKEPDELTEVPLMSAMFLAMVWHARRRMLAIEEFRRVSETNLRLLERERQFIQGASHELRTPITIALGHAELVARGSGDPELSEDARVVVDELLRLRRLADRLLLLAAADDPDFLDRAPIEVAQLLEGTMQRWAPTPRQWGIGNADRATVLGDADRLELALDALIENAVKRTTEGDSITLAAHRLGDDVVIAVSDTGPGIAADKVDRIFDRFARLDAGRSREGGGVGLGLTLVEAIAQAHGGSVRVHSRLGHGSTFGIVLPLNLPQPSASLDTVAALVRTSR